MFEVEDQVEADQLTAVLQGISRTIRDVVIREITESPSDYNHLIEKPIPADPALDALEHVVESINTGKPLQPKYDSIAKLVNNQEHRAELIDSLLLTSEYQRILRFLRARGRVENILLSVAEQGKLSPTEAIAFMQLINTEIKGMMARIRAGADSMKDITSLLNKVDYTMTLDETALEKQFDGTSPQQREIIRRVAHKLSKLTKNNK